METDPYSGLTDNQLMQAAAAQIRDSTEPTRPVESQLVCLREATTQLLALIGRTMARNAELEKRLEQLD